MKAIILLSICLGLLNSATTDIKSIKPTPVVGVSTLVTLGIEAGVYSSASKTKVFFNKVTGETAADTLNCEIQPATAQATTADCTVTIPEAVEYKMKTGADVQANGFTASAKLISAIEPVKIANATKSTVKLTAVTTIAGTEKVQFSKTTPASNADPAPVTCTAATDKKSTECEVTIATDGAYLLFFGSQYHGQTLTVSSGFLTLALGFVSTLFLF